MFKIMENIRTEFSAVEDYSISETSLEQVFISFAKKQISTEKTDNIIKKKLSEHDDEDVDGGRPEHQTKLVRYLSTVSRVSEKYDNVDDDEIQTERC